MKLLLLKILLQRRARDEGFTLPMVIALGLVMLLLGTVNIVKSSEENLTAINTNSSSDAIAIAEIGIARYRELLNQNRILTIYNQDQWDANANITGQTCIDMTAAPTGWTGTATKPNDTAATATDASTTDNDNWWEIKENIDGTAGDETIGEYRLVSYEYDRDNTSIREDSDNNGTLDDTTPDNENGVFSVLSDANTNDDNDPPIPPSGVAVNSITEENDTNDDGESDARGILTVQGRSPDGSEAQIQVDIPLRINDLDNLAPLLWVGGGSITNVGGNDKLNLSNGNIVMSNSGGNCPAIADIDSNDVINDSRDLPDIINDPDGVAAVPASGSTPEIPAVPGLANDKKNSITTINTSSSGTGSNLLLPRPTDPDKKNDDGRFYYRTANTVTIDNNKLETDGVAKVSLYVDGADINISGSATIGNYNPDVTAGTVSSHNLEIYVDGSQTIDIDPGGGTVNIEAFIHAPDSTLEISGTGTVNINGAVWVADYDNSGGATVNIRRDQTDTATGSEAAYKFYTTTANRTARPLTSSPTNWVREEVE